MNRSTRALAQIGTALLLSLVAAFLIFRWMSDQAGQQTQVLTTPVVVATSAIRKGARLIPESLEVKKYPVEMKPAGAFADPEGLAGKVLAVSVGANEAITMTKLIEDRVMGGISTRIAPGKRAMAVKGNMVMGLSGFVLPGDRVDVLVSMTEGRKENPITKLVLERIKVLATGTQLDSPTEEGSTASVDVYTLELSPEESERIALAASQGTLNFALRNAADNATVLTTGQTPKSTLAALRKQSKSKKRKARRQGHSVVVISGDQSSKVKF